LLDFGSNEIVLLLVVVVVVVLVGLQGDALQKSLKLDGSM